MDGGIRRGQDILKALALGAKGVLIGRAPLGTRRFRTTGGGTRIMDVRSGIEACDGLLRCSQTRRYRSQPRPPDPGMKHLLLALILFSLPAAAQMQKLVALAILSRPTTSKNTRTANKRSVATPATAPARTTSTRPATRRRKRSPAPRGQPALCGACHTEQNNDFTASKHGKAMLAGGAQKSPACTRAHGTHMLRTATQTEQQCKRCHAQLPTACSSAPPAQTAKVSCANCHDKHKMVVAKR